MQGACFVPRSGVPAWLAALGRGGVVVLTTVLGPCRALDDGRRDPLRPL